MNRQKGFTLAELLVVMPAMFMVAAFLAAFLVTLYSEALIKNGKLELGIEAQNTLFNLRDDLFFANRFAGTIQPDANDPYAPSGGWNALTHDALIVYEAAYDKNRQTPSRQLVFERDKPYPCNAPNLNENQISTNTMVFFVSNGTLYKRTLIPNQTNNCLATFRLNTCPAANVTPTCPADSILATNVKSLSFTYYNRTGDQINEDTFAADIDRFIQVQRADVTLELEKKVAGEPINAIATISVKKTE